MFSAISPERVLQVCSQAAAKYARNQEEREEFTSLALLGVCRRAAKVNAARHPSGMVWALSVGEIRNAIKRAIRGRERFPGSTLPDPGYYPFELSDTWQDFLLACATDPHLQRVADDMLGGIDTPAARVRRHRLRESLCI